VAKEKQEFQATGRRKKAVASIYLKAGTGSLLINGKDFRNYFTVESTQNFICQPFKVTNTEKRFDIKAKVSGGGIIGQAGALRHGISRALVLADDSLRAVLKNTGLLTRDPRTRERKKAGQPGARKRFQFSKR